MEVAPVDFESELERLRVTEKPTLVLIHEPPKPPASVALLSGSFDPMTVAHGALAEAASRLVDLVLLVYSARTLPKDGAAPPALLPEVDRLRALGRFCETHPGTAAGFCSHGLLADQVLAARERFPTQDLFMTMGSDKVLQLLHPSWYEDRDRTLEGLFREAAVLYADRAGEEGAVEAALRRTENARWADRFTRLDVPTRVAAVSSSRIRELIEAGTDPSGLVVEESRPYLPQP
jgi:nicotinic acid mononucleotide adenylyltransferase